MQGRCRGDAGEMQGRYRGDTGAIQGRYRVEGAAHLLKVLHLGWG
jgi:hypothetical protein